jgi:type IV pilus assembly protein PilN
MILINLLPHREEKRRLRKQAFFAGVGAALLVGCAILAFFYAVQMSMMATQRSRNDILSAAIHKLDDEIKDVSGLRSEIDALKARQRAVEDLQTDRNMPVYLLNELVSQTPEGLYLNAVHQNGQSVTVSGFAQTNERVSEFLRNTNSKSTWLERPELIEIKAATSTGKDARDNKRFFDFSMRVSLKRPGDVSSAASGASAPGAAASGVKPVGSAASAPVKSGG